MKNTLCLGVKFLLIFSILLLSISQKKFATSSFARITNSDPQEYPVQKPKYDYMSSFLSRNTKPLGLKEDIALRKRLRQANIKWAIRAGTRHIFN